MTTNYTPNFALALPDFRMGPWHDLLNGDISKIDQLLYGALSPAGTVTWVNDTLYDAGLTVFDGDDATTWMCNVTHTTPATGTFGDERTAQPTYWVQLLAGFAPRGEWQNNTNYYPYDMAYSSSLGILGLCKVRHVSNATGTMKDDQAVWSFLVDFGDLTNAAALTVSYDGTASGIPATNVQTAIDHTETQIVALDNVNVTQGSQISALQTKDTVHETRMTNIEAKDASQDTSITNLQNSDTNLQNQINARAVDSNAVHKSGDTMNGVLNSANSGVIQTAGPVASFMVQGPQNGHATMSFLVQGQFGANLGMDSGGNFYIGGWSFGNTAYKFWTTRDFTALPSPGVTSMRLAFAGDIQYTGSTATLDPFGGTFMSGWWLSGQTMTRWRYVQFFINGGWYTAGYA